MKVIIYIVLIGFNLLGHSLKAQVQQIAVPYTLADRDRIISIESRVNSLESRVETGFKDLQRQIDELGTRFYWGFGIIITLFIFMMGYIIWDRRTAMKPALEQASRAMEDNRAFLKVLRDYSKKHPDLAEILRSHGIL